MTGGRTTVRFDRSRHQCQLTNGWVAFEGGDRGGQRSRDMLGEGLEYLSGLLGNINLDGADRPQMVGESMVSVVRFRSCFRHPNAKRWMFSATFLLHDCMSAAEYNISGWLRLSHTLKYTTNRQAGARIQTSRRTYTQSRGHSANSPTALHGCCCHRDGCPKS